MTQEITRIKISMVNCYLIKDNDNFFMVDTGFGMQRRRVLREMSEAGCQPGKLKLIIITHADSDHVGNAAYIRENYDTRVAMHEGEATTAETGDMRRNRPALRNQSNLLARAALGLPFNKLGKANRFKPDIYLEDGQDLSEYGWDAQALHLPGHSCGSIGVLTGGGDLLCGDLLLGNKKPKKNSLVDSAAEMDASIERLKNLGVKMVYPGHGRPFKMAILR